MNLNNLIDYNLHHEQKITNCANISQIKSPNDSSIRIFYLNARSVASKVEEIQHLIHSTSIPEVMIFSETWINQNHSKYFQMDGFSSFLLGRENRSGGGVGIFVKRDWGVANKIYEYISRIIEILVVQVKKSNETYTFVAIYRPPIYLNIIDRDEYLMQLELILTKFDGEHTYIIGDQNLNIIDDSSDLNHSYLSLLRQYNKVVQNEGFVSRPFSNTCIDHIVVDFTIAGKINVQTLQYLNLDHFVFFIDLPVNCHNVLKEKPLYFVKKYIDYDKMKLILPDRLGHIDEKMHVDQIYDEIVFHLKNTLNECSYVKVIKRKTKYKKQWMDVELHKLIDEKEHWLRLRNENSNNQFYQAEYKKWRNIVTSKKREKKKEFNSRKFERCKGDSKKTWNCMKELMFDGQINNSVIKILSTSTVNSDKQMKIDEFNNYYATIGDHFVPTYLNNNAIPKKMFNDEHFEFDELNLEQTKNLIMTLKNKNSKGPDGISPILVKFFCDELAPYVKLLINESLKTGYTPNATKIARVIGIYKGGNADHVSNFRPISVTSIFGKLIEMWVNSQLSLFIEKNKILSSEQYGFRLNSNTTSACFDLMNKVCKSRDDGNVTCLTFIDTQKAFNSVNRRKLIDKLRNIGIVDNALNWFHNFFSNNKQYSECDDFESEIVSVDTGLMQGSILSPLLFNIYSCDLELMNFEGLYYCFADDLCFQHTAKSIDSVEQMANEDMEKFEAYMNENDLTVNINKTKYMMIGNNERRIQIKYSNSNLDLVEEYKYLGLTITSDLRWYKHIKKLNNNLSALAGVFWKISNHIPMNLKKSLYHSMFASHLLYCLPIFGSTTNDNIIQIQRFQSKALKNLYMKDKYYSPRKLLEELGLLSVIDLYKFFAYSHIHLIKNGLIHSNTFIEERNHVYETRNRNNLFTVKIHSMTWGENNPLRRAIIYYNDIDNKIKQEMNIKSFKTKLKAQFLSKK